MSQPFTQKSSKIFISYRRDEHADAAGRLSDNLIAHFGKDQIFMDIDHIEPGEDFVQVITEAVSSCRILIAIIGKGWLSSSKDGSTRRLDNPNDFVRLEIATALSRNVRVIPVLIQGATMPAPQDLPDDLVQLSHRQAFELSHRHWKQDVESLISSLQRILERQQQEAQQAEARREREAKEAAKAQRKREDQEAARRAEEKRLHEEEEERRKHQEEEAARQRAAEEAKRRAEEQDAARKRAAEQEEKTVSAYADNPEAHGASVAQGKRSKWIPGTVGTVVIAALSVIIILFWAAGRNQRSGESQSPMEQQSNIKAGDTSNLPTQPSTQSVVQPTNANIATEPLQNGSVPADAERKTKANARPRTTASALNDSSNTRRAQDRGAAERQQRALNALNTNPAQDDGANANSNRSPDNSNTNKRAPVNISVPPFNPNSNEP